MQQMLNAAIVFAATAHDGQFDKAGKPYFLHVLQVRENLKDSDEERNCIAVLHDVIEDTDATYQQLRDIGMSDRVIEGVRLLTKVKGQTPEEYLEAVLSSEDAMFVKLADLEHNMDLKRLKGITQKDLNRVEKYVVMYHTIQQALVNAGWEFVSK